MPTPFALASLPSILFRLHSVGAILFACGAFAIYAAWVILREKWRVHRTRNWPTLPGAITEVKPEFVSGGANGIDYWKVHFVYTYSVEGHEYSGKYSVNCTNKDMSTAAAASLAAAEAIVHYNPADPAHSVLWDDEVMKLW